MADKLIQLKDGADNLYPCSADAALSTTAKQIGTYNGSPLYRKVLSGTLPATISGVTQILTDSILRADHLVRFDGMFWNSSGSGFIPSGYYTASNDFAVVYPQSGALNIVCGRPALFQGQAYKFIVDYI
ncbi:MAG: hypothetical protein IKG39_06015 [Lachnospiraceae bacterium]|nr:hypothetical protein [Lachnospiraceae bacterium]